MTGSVHSTRLRVDLNSKHSLVFSYPDLLKRHEKALKAAPLVPMLGNDEQDSFYKALLERAAKYDVDPGDDVNSSDEDTPMNKDGKGDEYDYEDPFIDDSDMMLDDSYEYSLPEFDGFFVYHGTLDGTENPSGSKKKSSTKKDKPTTSTSSKAKSSTPFTAARKSSAKADPIELTDTDDDTEKINTQSSSANPKLKRSSSSSTSSTTAATAASGTAKSDSAGKSGPTMKKSTSSSTSTLTDGPKKTAAKKTKSAIPASSSSSAPSSQLSSGHTALTTGKKAASSSSTTAATATGATSGSAGSSSASSTQTGSSATGDKNKKAPKPTNANQPRTLDPSIEQLLEKLRIDRSNETFEVKSKFPSALRPTALQVGTQMFRIYHKLDETVLARLMDILPYNRFTLKKFLVTKSGPGVVEQLQQEIEKQMNLLTDAVNELMPEHIQQYEQKVLEQQNQMEDGPEVEKKFRCNDTIRRTLYEILTMDMHSNNISNEIAIFHNKSELVESETKARKSMYTKLLPCWPPGWMTTYDISRQYSTYKAKVKNTDQPLYALPSSSTGGSASGTKRLTNVPLKRSAPSSSIPTSLGTTLQGYPAGSEKRKKTTPANDQQAGANETAPRKDDVPVDSKVEQGDDDVIITDSAGIALVDQPFSSPSQKPSSMNIASLISGP
ncbi:hypothetical protein [Absidia glauca]|uniref:Ubinuclein middle domain-containing protein n=1 Tax=Absidia glauca TaxID=4829 RepID=A0A163MQA6_ABSGL|nr:hypothetical protein [Absidia glauca]